MRLRPGPGWAARLSAPAALFMVTGCSLFGGTAAEEPPHRVILDDGAFQVRQYAAYAIAETVVDDPYRPATNTGFRRLFNYISGANRGSSGIEMTAPVLVNPRKIDMTAPVMAMTARHAPDDTGTFDAGDGGWITAFILPEGVSAATAPAPEDGRIMLRDVPAGEVAAIRFSGPLRNGRAETRRRELAAWLEARGLAHAGDWRMAGYHPPWTLPPFRRNEVIVTLRGDD